MQLYLQSSTQLHIRSLSEVGWASENLRSFSGVEHLDLEQRSMQSICIGDRSPAEASETSEKEANATKTGSKSIFFSYVEKEGGNKIIRE